MTRLTTFAFATTALASLSNAFVPSTQHTSMPNTSQLYSSITADQQRTPVLDQSDFYFARLIDRSSVSKPSTTTDITAGTHPTAVTEAKKPSKKAAAHKEGVFSPVVYVAKDVLGQERLNKLRGDFIALHSDAIKGFVATADSKIGQAVLKQLFTLADKNKDGKIDKDELRTALKALRFEWLDVKQVNGIFERADLDQNGDIDMGEWMKEAPKTLKTNLVKLAKNNGGKMGLLV